MGEFSSTPQKQRQFFFPHKILLKMALTAVSGNSSFLFPFSGIPNCFFPMHFQKWCSGCPSLGRIMGKKGRGGKLEVFKLLQTSGCTWPYLAAFWCSPGPHLVFMNIFTVFVIWMLSQGKIQERAKETDFRSLYPEKYSFLKPKATSPRRLEVGKQY